ncbi:hypothetical protein NGB36_08960 [Streptomyces sp. RB6PN25]|uniref:SAF domain-containing protein n=1 Tax=Streptomyces humicola TaxID=2953240 RepID=A0ABT1PSS5_9ACTN|nr:hypothetical protein [Streptomyces humicola]MCQ4080729.1 hypothetical protein [Streptomyces humicola]
MRTKERTGAGGGANRPVATAGQGQGYGQGVGERLPVAPRERKPALAALAVLLILVGALGSTVLVLRAGNKIQAIKIIAPVAQGQSIPSSAITEVDVASGTGINYVPWSQRNELSGFRAATTLVPGTALVGEMLTQQSGLASGKVLVGLSLKDGQYPPGLKAGDTVAAYLVSTSGSTDSGAASGSSSGPGSGKTSSSSTAGGGNLLAASATVQSATPSTDSNGVSSGNLPVTLVVDQSDAPALAQAASAGQVALVVVPSGSGS